MSIMVQMISFVIASFRSDACLHTLFVTVASDL